MGLSCLVVAVLRLASPFSDGMVLQRDRPVPVWGDADAGAAVEVRFANQIKTTRAAADGSWRVTLDPMPVGKESRALAVISRPDKAPVSHLDVSDVLVGEVWICAGQSNMELPLWGVAHVSSHAEQAMDMGYVESMILNDRLVRTCQTPKVWAREPQDFPERLSWRRFSPGEQQEFSAIGCHFAQLLRQSLDVPVGVISVAWGGAKIEGFIPASGFRAAEGFEKMAEKPILAQDDPKQQFPKEPNDQPRSIWNGRIHALVPMAFRGMLWYQGESNIGEALRYEHLLAGLRTGWMTEFGRTELPVYVVQIAPFRYSWMEKGGILDFCDIWEGMANFVRNTPDAALVTTVDLGDQKNIHPAGKRTVALRLAANALNRIYGRTEIACVSPELDSAEADGKGNVRLTFRNVGHWLMHGEYAVPFELAGDDGKFCEAKVKWPSAGVIELSVSGMMKPSKVRYMWNWTKRATLANEYGFPLAPFRADVVGTPTETEVEAAEAASRSMQAEVARLRRENRRLERRIEALGTTDDLLSGRRKEIPVTTTTERLVLEMFKGKRIVIDNRKTMAPQVETYFLDLLPGRKYRIRLEAGMLALQNCYGMLIGCGIHTEGGGHQWPQATSGWLPFPTREISFDFELPEDSTVEFRFGFPSGQGRGEFGDLRVYELQEVTK